MRPIKLRAWIDGEMIYPKGDLYIAFYDDPTCVEWAIISRYDGTVLYDHDITISDSENNELMQFTGLYDKNGKEIYEGDLVNYADIKHGYDSNRWEVIFYTGAFRLAASPRKIRIYDIGICKGIEVIGNIYEYPDLL